MADPIDPIEYKRGDRLIKKVFDTMIPKIMPHLEVKLNWKKVNFEKQVPQDLDESYYADPEAYRTRIIDVLTVLLYGRGKAKGANKVRISAQTYARFTGILKWLGYDATNEHNEEDFVMGPKELLKAARIPYDVEETPTSQPPPQPTKTTKTAKTAKTTKTTKTAKNAQPAADAASQESTQPLTQGGAPGKSKSKSKAQPDKVPDQPKPRKVSSRSRPAAQKRSASAAFESLKKKGALIMPVQFWNKK